MMSADRKEASPAVSPKVAEELAKYGITRVPVDYFHHGIFRYTNLEDAVAQAKREQRSKDPRRVVSPSPETTEELAKYGITRVPVDYFYYGRYRYTNLEDAVAEAKRDQRSS
jgi:uroporphyrinogen-III synthase